jgi:hypothetical protein
MAEQAAQDHQREPTPPVVSPQGGSTAPAAGDTLRAFGAGGGNQAFARFAQGSGTSLARSPGPAGEAAVATTPAGADPADEVSTGIALAVQRRTSGPVLSRDPAAPEAPGKSVGVALLEANRDKLEDIRAQALVRMGRLTKLESSSREAIGAVKTTLMATSHEYDKAYENYARIIKKAKQEAENQQFWTDIAVGIAIGVLVGMCFEAVPVLLAVEAAAGAAGAGLKAAGKAAAKAAPKEAAGEVAEAGLGQLAKKVGIAVAGTDLEPGDMRPEILKMGIWKSLTKLHEAAPKIGGQSLTQGLLMSNAEYAIGEIKAHSGGGQGDLSEQDAIDLVLAVLKCGDASKDVDKKLDAAEAKVTALQAAAATKSTYGAKEMERDIWILWMGSLKEDSNILDIDAIEDYIGPKGLGLVDFGIYTFDSDENEAIRKAAGQRKSIEERRKAAMGAGEANPVGAAEKEVPGSTAAPPKYGEDEDDKKK